MLLKRWDVSKPAGVGAAWSAKHLAWLRGLTGSPSRLKAGARGRLASYLRQLDFVKEEAAGFDAEIGALAKTPRYAPGVAELRRERGVGLLTAMTFLAELGDPHRFQNRGEIAAFLGLAPSSHESGEADDRKGHITHQGSKRLRKILCQASWARVRCDEKERRWYDRLVARGDAKKRRRLAIVGEMRRLAIRLWNAAKRATAPLPSPQGGEAPACASGAATPAVAGAGALTG
jgi:transposase